jgi:hypothetical protein
MDTKNANGNVSGTIRLFNMEITAKVNIIFGLAKQKRNFFRVPLKNLLSNN